MGFKSYVDRDMLALGLADLLASELEKALRNNERVSLAVPGGTTPAPIFEGLNAVTLDWERVDVILTDERWVPESSERSNGRLVRRHLLTGPAAAAHFLPYYREGMTPAEACPMLCDELAGNLPLSVLLLGMGSDMHTASLFPGAGGLEAALADDAPMLVPIQAEGQEPRVSLSAQALKGAVSKHLVITGQEKLEAFQRAQDLDPSVAPIAAVLSNLNAHWAE